MAHMGTPNGMTQLAAHPEVERHIRQNNERLRCIQRHLQSPSGFEKAAKELLEWCSDPRAFQKAFEESLMNCLTVISEVASKPGYNLSLAYRLLAVCSANRDKFSPKSSSHLHAWCEDLGKLLLLQHQSKSNMPNDGMRPVVPNPSGNPHAPLDPAYCSNGPMGTRMGRYPPDGHTWNHGVHDQTSHRGMPGSMHQRPALSVTTTVWGVTDATQSPAIRGQGHPSMNRYSMGPNPTQHPRQHGVGYPMDIYGRKTGPYPNAGPYQRNDYVTSTHRGVPGPGYGPNSGPHQVHNMRSDANEYPPPAAAAAAAAVAAAAATATATATAMVVNDQQQQQNDMYGQMGHNNTAVMHPMDPSGHNVPPGQVPRDPGLPMDGMGPSTGRASMRHGMYGQYGPVGKSMGAGPHHAGSPAAPPPNHGMGGFNSMNPQYRPAYRSNSVPNSYCPTSPYDAPPSNQFKPPPMSGHPPPPPQNGFSPRVPTPGPMLTATPGPDIYPSVSSAGSVSPYPNSQLSMTPNGPPHPPNGPMGFTSPRPSFYGPGPMGRGPHQPPDPMPGNPTPPITPGSAHNVPPFPGPDVKPPMPIDVKPIIPNHGSMQPLNPQTPKEDTAEIRMSFPVRDGVVMEPFRLEHNRSISTKAFQLRSTAYSTLMWRPDLELEFKCYHHDDKYQHTNWPHSVQITVNGTKMHIQRHPYCKPLYLRDVCKGGRNEIDIEVSTCCCSHYFVLQLVHRPNVHSVLMGLLTKRMLPAASSVTKIKRLFQHRLVTSMPRSLVGSPGENGAGFDDENSALVSLRCPITYKRINLPARGSECRHIQCFDLEAYLQLNSDHRTWCCPVCRKTALLEGLEVDQYIWSILKKAHKDDVEVVIDSRCNWKPIVMKGYAVDEEGPARKRMKSTGMSPATMFSSLPSPGSYVPHLKPLPATRLSMTPDMAGSGGCGFPGNSNGMGRNLTQTPGPPMNGPMMGMGRPSSAHGPAKNMSNMTPGTPGAMIHRANPLSRDNIAADDMVTITKTLNPARMTDSGVPGNPTPNLPIGNHHPPSNQLIRQSSISNIQSPVSLPQQQHQDQRIRNSGTPSNMNPLTPSANPKTPSMDILSPQPPMNNSNGSIQNFNTSRTNNALALSTSSAPCNTNPGSELNFDPNLVISGTGIGENDDKIPSLDILPENTDPLELIDYLGTNNTVDPSEDDILSMFDNTN